MKNYEWNQEICTKQDVYVDKYDDLLLPKTIYKIYSKQVFIRLCQIWSVLNLRCLGIEKDLQYYLLFIP